MGQGIVSSDTQNGEDEDVITVIQKIIRLANGNVCIVSAM